MAKYKRSDYTTSKAYMFFRFSIPSFMKKLFITVFLLVLVIPFVFSQVPVTWTIVKEYGDEVGHHYVKRVENNFVIFDSYYNLSSKVGVEILFFGDSNALVEFSYEHLDEGAYGFRVVRDTLRKSHILEVKYISNYREANKEVSDKYPFSPPISIDSMKTLSKKENEEKLKLYKIETRFFPVSDQFAEKLHEKIASFIINFKSKGFSGIGGTSSVENFRTVVDNDELWTLRIYTPKGNARKWSDLCRQIITDAQSNQLDEEKYITILNTFEN